MELFQKNKNIMFECVSDIINDMVINHKTYSKEELERYFQEKSIWVYEKGEIVKDLKFDKVENLFDREEGVFHCLNEDKRLPKNAQSWGPRINSQVPAIPTLMEMRCLEGLAGDPLSRDLLSDTTLEKLNQTFQKSDNGRDNYLYRNRRDTLSFYNYPDRNNQLTVIIKAIVAGKKIRYTNVTRNKVFENQIASVYRLVYSSRLNRIQIIARPDKEDRVILMNAWGVRDVVILQEDAVKDFDQWIESKKKELVIVIDSGIDAIRQQNTVERCFSLFSHLDKFAEYDEKTDRHKITVSYYEFDEADIIKDILSLGSAVIVEKPAEVREKIIETIRKICST